jgi:HlyD family secretion protein
MRGFVLFVFGLAVGACAAFVYFAARGEAVFSTASRDTAANTPTSGRSATAQGSRDAGRPERESVHALGTIEPADGIVSIASPLAGFKIAAIHVREGQLVSAGDLLIELEATHPQAELDLVRTQLDEAEQRRQSELRLAEQRLRAADLAFQQASQGGQLELEAQRARVTAVAARQRQAERDLERLEELRRVRESLASEQQLEQQRVLAESAAAELMAAELSLRGLEQSLDFQRRTAEAELEGARISHELARQDIGLEALRQRIELARLQLRKTEIHAPVDGTVLTLAVRAGELVAQQPLLQLADLTSLVCLAEIYAADVPLLRKSQPAEVRFRGWSGHPIPGRLDRVGSAVAASRLRPLDPRRPVDHHVAQGVVKLDVSGLDDLPSSNESPAMSAWVGLQVEVKFPLASFQKPAEENGP